MTKLELFSEPFAATGGMDARASKRAIGKSHINFWPLFLRETLQNSWDARAVNGHGITFRADARRLNQDELAVMRDSIFTSLPIEQRTAEAFSRILDSRSVDILTITDQGTKGLGGQTRADLASGSDGCTDFVDFVRNVGRSEEKGYQGGTYGFGKGVLYTASQISTCIVYTQTYHNGSLEARLIAICVSDRSYDHGGRRYTGRHWWGDLNNPNLVEPITGEQARGLAESLGITSLGPMELGTSVTVVAPEVNESSEGTLSGVLDEIKAACLNWAWPHMVDLGTGPTINFEFCLNGVPTELRGPNEDPALRDFVRAYRAVAVQRGATPPIDRWPVLARAIDARRLRGPKRLGILGFESRQRTDADSGQLHTIALIREPKFIVKYLRVPEVPGMTLRGVFIADEHYDSDFAKSEPVAHDDWIPSEMGLVSGSRNPVRIALDGIKETLKSHHSLVVTSSARTQPSGIAKLSQRLSVIMGGANGPGAEGRASRPSPKRAPKATDSLKVTIQPDPELQLVGDEIRVAFAFSIATPTGLDSATMRLTAEVFVAVADGRAEITPPANAPMPTIVGWFKNGEMIQDGAVITADQVPSGLNELVVSPPPDTAIGLNIKYERIRGEL